MEELTIEEIVFLWGAKYKYDHILHGFTFKEDGEPEEKAQTDPEELKGLYGDLF